MNIFKKMGYNSKAKDFVSGTVDVTFTEIQDTFLGFIPVGGKILDFGCFITGITGKD